LEILAVLLIGALLYSFAMPNFSLLNASALRDQAELVVAYIDLGRQRAAITGVPHRLSVNLDEGTYALEWQGSGQDGSDFEPTYGDEPLSLEPTRQIGRAFTSLPGLMGRQERLVEDVWFTGVETPGGWVEAGETFVTFYSDGTSMFTTLAMENGDGAELSLEILPLADRVRIRDESF
jgi:type II secretory pathway pseudopilin PulG